MNYAGSKRDYELLHILEFDSTRKRMSVIVKCFTTDKILLLCKGAESFVYEKCPQGDISACDTQISQFAVLGWRTLAICYRILSEKEYEDYDKMLTDAANDI